MNLRTTTQAAFPTGNAMPNLAGLGVLPDLAKPREDRSQQEQPDLAPGMETVADTGLGAMTGLGVALLFNAGLAIAGLVGWELFVMFR